MPFPYSDLSGSKARPVLVMSNDRFNTFSQDIIVCCVTSNINKDFYTVLLNQNYLESGKLFGDCCVKVENIAKIEKSMVLKSIGRVKKETFSKIMEKLQALFQ